METKTIDPFQTDGAGKRTLRSFSLAERGRRYAQVRKLMAERDLECLLVPATDGGEAQANSRYLSQVGGVQGGAWVVFPAAGEATAIVSAEREWRMWTANLIWPEDLRWGNFSRLVPDRQRSILNGILQDAARLRDAWHVEALVLALTLGLMAWGFRATKRRAGSTRRPWSSPWLKKSRR